MSPEQRADAAPPSATPAPPVRETRSLTEDVFGLYSTRVVIIGLSMCSGDDHGAHARTGEARGFLPRVLVRLDGG